MSAGRPSALRLVSFGDPGGEVWGSAIEAGQTALAFATPAGTGAHGGAGEIQLDSGQDAWRLAGDGVELLVTPVGDEDTPSGAQLCHVEGTLSAGGSPQPVSCPGTRSVADPGRAALESVRAVSGWFADDRAVALCALRPAGSQAHERDEVTATVFDPDQWLPVADPRLSTTYRPGEHPTRASLELWVGEGEELYPRRAAVEASGDAVGAQGDGVRIEVTPLLCHSGGLDGAGVYLIAHL